MKDQSFYIQLAGSLILAVLAGYTLNTGLEFGSLWASLEVAAGLFLLKNVERKSRKTGRTDRLKASLTSSTILFELLILIGAFSLSIVPKSVAVITMAAVAFTEILSLELVQKLKTSFNPPFGRETRIGIIVVGLLAYFFNPFFMFYAALTVFLVSIYDSVKYAQQVWQET